MKYVIEPHADDAFLSMGGHIEEWVKKGEAVTIVTVYSATPKRGAEAKAYADAVGAAWIGCGAVEAGSMDGLPATFELPSFNDAFDIFVPLGIRHEEHKLVRAIAEGTIGSRIIPTLSYYLDQPYALQPSNSAEVSKVVAGMIVGSYLKPTARKYRHIPIFKTQSKFFFYNPIDSLKHSVEMTFAEDPDAR